LSATDAATVPENSPRDVTGSASMISSAWLASEVNSSSLSGVGAARLAAGEKVHHIRGSRLPDVLAPLAFMLSYDVPLLTSDVVRLLPREQAMRRAC
jgi:hypothetical protein